MNEYATMLSISDLTVFEVADFTPDFYGAVLVTGGKLTATVGDKVLNIPQNHILISSPDTISFVNKGDGCEAFFFSFKGNGEILNKIKNKAFYLEDDKLNLITSSLFSDSSLKQYQLDLILRLIFTYCYELDDADLVLDKKDAVIFSKAVSLLEKNIGGEISVNQLSDKLNVSLSQIKRTFAKYSKLGAHEYLIALKIIKAKELLRENISVTETARLVGFATQGYFSAAFKKITGVSPKTYYGEKAEDKKIKQKTQAPKKTPQKENLPSYLL